MCAALGSMRNSEMLIYKMYENDLPFYLVLWESNSLLL